MRSEVWAGGGRAWAGGSARAACTGRGPGCEGWAGEGMRGAHVEHVASTGRDRLKKGCGARARAERTWNIRSMFVTLEVSKLSGWLNALAICRVERRACEAGRGAAREA